MPSSGSHPDIQAAMLAPTVWTACPFVNDCIDEAALGELRADLKVMV
jgi:hypothetical protein